jgi:hypothetical protein
MTNVPCVRSLAERLATIAADCFDQRAAERLRALADELHDPNRQKRMEQEGPANAAEGAAPA